MFFFYKLGTIAAIAELINEFSPVNYHSIWTEFKIYSICSAMLNQANGTDLTMQSNLITICTHLLAGIISNRIFCVTSPEINSIS